MSRWYISSCRVFASEILTLIYDTNIQMCGEITDSTDNRSPAVRYRDQYWWHNVRGGWFKFIQSTSMPPLPLHLMFGIKYKGCRVVFFAEFLFKPRNLIFHVHTVQRRLVALSTNLRKILTMPKDGFYHLSLSQLDKNLLMHYDHKANILKAVKKEKAVVWTFSVHCETLRSIVDSSTDYWGGQETTAQ